MSWKVRHEGSPTTIDGLTVEQVAEGLQEGRWEPTDEVRGPYDPDWVAIENHPLLAEAAAEVEPPPPRSYDDETRLDMNPLIDVCLVLLVFFILTTTYAVLQKRMDSPDVAEGKTGVAVVTEKDVKNQMIKVSVKMENGAPVVRVEEQPVPLDNLEAELHRFVRKTSRNQLLLEHDNDVPHGVVVRVQDAAKGAGMDKVNLLVP